jgi:hypothetical protein
VRSIVTNIVEMLWSRLQIVLAAFATKLAASDPALCHKLGRTSNESFLLRAYLAFSKRSGGDELAITVDVQSDGQQLAVASDACTDDGRVIAEGPSATIPLSADQMEVEVALSSWLVAFERFLVSGEQAIGIETARLS